MIGVATLTARLFEFGTCWASVIVGYDVTGRPNYATTLYRGKR